MRATKPVKPHKPTPGISQYHELNIVRLALISIQRQIEKTFVEWEYTFELDGEEASLECKGHQDLGVPHGLDSDFYNAIVHLFVQKGANEDGVLTTTAYEIIRTAGRVDSKHSYQSLHESLRRLLQTQYYLKKSWRNHKKRMWETLSFQHIEKLQFITEETEHGNDLSSRSVIRIKLPQEVVHSVQAGYMLLAPEAALRALEQPTSRALYRLLEARRRDPMNPQVIVDELHYNLMDWARDCKLSTDVPKLIRRALENAHQELIGIGYLREVNYSGRGQKQTLEYLFHPRFERVVDQQLVDLLKSHGVFPGVAQNLVSKYPERINPSLQRLKQLITEGYPVENRAGLLIRIIQNPADYSMPQESPPAVRTLDVPRAAPSEPEPLPVVVPDLKTMKFLLQPFEKDLGTRELQMLWDGLEEGSIDPLQVETLTVHARMPARREEALQELRALLKKWSGSALPGL
ncbi:replication initiator protein A [Deinococcus roseus]|uniref:Plasmid replication initiator protein n=1 Tax=Deinococcus roseus TaxID=392414 RepID=A0ABQ2D7X2_9DEIO|nr:replication initiator protein A [Deinococcus roseus]GGJ47788.1 hypothetical protein GCM10008938_37210 [Deinococcus roseus]